MIRRLWTLILLLGLVLPLGVPGWGAPRVVTDHARPTRTFNVCMLLLYSQRNDGNTARYWNSDPWFLPVLNHSPYKPAGWTLQNPLAPAKIPANAELIDSATKFQADPKGAGATSTNWYLNGKAIGAALTKDDPAYWVVQLDKVSLEALAEFDLIILNGHNTATLNNDERNAIRYLLERGAAIWINNSQRRGNQVLNFFLDPAIVFQPGPYDWPLPANTTTWMKVIAPDHWLLNAHYAIAPQQASFLRDNIGDRSFIQSGVAGYAGGATSQVQEVVRLIRNNADGTVTAMGPSIAAGRVGNGLLIVSGTDIMGAVADWFERKHNIANLRNLDVWPSNESMHIVGAPNDHYIYTASTKLVFNMLARPATWSMVSGNPVASRTYDARFAAALSRGWSAQFTTIGDPVSSGNFVAVTGTAVTPPGMDADELRLYRTRKLTDDGGAVLDYPYGLFDDYQRKLTPTLISYWQAKVNYVAGGVVRRNAYFYYCAWNHISDTTNMPGTPGGAAIWVPYPSGPYPMWQEGYDYTLGDAIIWNGLYFFCKNTHRSNTIDNRPFTGINWRLYWTTLFPSGPFVNDATNDNEMDLCFRKSPSNGWAWIGSPVFGKVTQGALTRTVLYALQRRYIAGNWEYQIRAFPVDPFVITSFQTPVGEDLWIVPSPVINIGIPRVSMTLSNNRLVVTALGKTNVNSNWRIFVFDARTGAECAHVGGAPEYGANFRPTSPASMVTARVEFEASDLEAGLSVTSGTITSSTYNPRLPKLRREVVEMLAVAGEYFSPNTTASLAANPNTDPHTGGQAALFLVPPTFIFRSTSSQRGIAFASMAIPPDLTVIDADGRSYVIGSPSSDFRRRYVLCIKTEASGLKITFRNWDAFFPQGGGAAALKLPLSLRFTPERTIVGGGSAQSQTPITVQGLQLSMGYPILLRGTQRFDLSDGKGTPYRSTLHWFDGDVLYDNASNILSGGTFGYAVDTPPLVFRDALVIGTNTVGATDYPGLKGSQDIAQTRPLRLSGALNAVRLRLPGLSKASNTAPPGQLADLQGEMVWQFQGDTHGPRNWNLQQWFWRSNFPYPAAAAGDAVYATALYDGYGDYEGGNTYSTLAPSSLNRGVLYAVDPDAPRYLMQTMAAGVVTNDATPLGYDATRTLAIDQGGLQDAVRRNSLRVGARVLLKHATATWDMGTVLQIRRVDGAVHKYWVVFDRPYDVATFTPAGCLAFIATTVPHVSHVRGWNATTGEEPLRRYLLNGEPAVRTSEGICATPPAGQSACPDNSANTQEVMIAFNELSTVCHNPWSVDGGNTLAPNDDRTFLPADWRQRNVAYLPRYPMSTNPSVYGVVSAANNTTNMLPEQNYLVDARTGRIQLNPRATGEFADRFVVVHYYTQDMASIAGLGVKPMKVHHAEVMYVPSPVRWQYLFPDAIPDSGPVVVNDTLYVTAIRRTLTNTWQPTLYAFATVPADPLRVQPLWSQPLGAVRPDTDPLPYRGVTTAVPTPSGVLVGTALPNVTTNELTLFTDRGLVIADGHRILRADQDGQVTLQASATKDYDPMALFFAATGDPVLMNAIQSIGLTQQAFTLVTRVRRLPNGNLLACDTGAGRVVELNREGVVEWAYPDSNLSYMDPDRKLDGTRFRPVSDAGYFPDMTEIRAQGITPAKLRLNGPRDVRRYYTEKAINDPNMLKWDLLPGGRRLGRATVRWEITVIADTGNSRIIETIRPLVRLDDADIEEVGALSYARGFAYRPDLYYIYNGARVYLRQYTEVLAYAQPGATLTGAGLPGEQLPLAFADGAALKSAMTFSAAMRYPGSDGQLTFLRADADPLFDGVRTRELLVAIGSPVADPANAAKFLRTAFVHVGGGTQPATLGNYASLTQAATAGDTTLHLSYAADLKVGDRLLAWNPTNPDPKAVSTTVITAVNAATKEITVNPALDKNFILDSRVVAVERWNALAIRAASPRDYASIAQLDLVTLTTPAGGQAVRALVVDAVGVREVPTDPNTQGTPVFEMTQPQYTAATLNSALWTSMVDRKYPARPDTERTAMKDTITRWKKDARFAPVAVLRLDPGAGLTATDPRAVRYLIAQMNTTINPDPTTWMNNKAERRIHLFEARWFDRNAADQNEPNNGWRIIDSEWNYFVYPDPLSPGFPNLPGWSYPLSQPLSLDRD